MQTLGAGWSVAKASPRCVDGHCAFHPQMCPVQREAPELRAGDDESEQSDGPRRFRKCAEHAGAVTRGVQERECNCNAEASTRCQEAEGRRGQLEGTGQALGPGRAPSQPSPHSSEHSTGGANDVAEVGAVGELCEGEVIVGREYTSRRVL